MSNKEIASITEEDAIGSQLINHWTKPLGVVGYYWFLTFDDSNLLRSAVVDCQSRLAFPYYDPAPLDSLHLTVNRIARAGELSSDRLRAIQNDARRGLGDMTPFELAIGAVRRVPSAIIFDVAPARNISELRAKLRGGPSIGVSESCTPPLPHAPHVTIAYGNADGIAPPELEEAVAAVNRSVRAVRVRVSEVSMVLLHRRRSMYSWDLIGRIPLGESI